MSFASQVVALAIAVGEQVKTLTNRVTSDVPLRTWTGGSVFRVGQFAVINGKLWKLDDVDGSRNVPPPGPYRSQYAAGYFLSGASAAAGNTNVDAIHGACFTITSALTITNIRTAVLSGLFLADDTVLSVWVGLASDAPPTEETPPHGTLTVQAGVLTPTSSGLTVKLTAPWTPPINTPLIVWFGPTGSLLANNLRTTGAGFSDVLTESAVEYVIRPRGGVKTDQSGRFLGFGLNIAGTTNTVWQEALSIVVPPPAVASDLYTVTLNGTAVLFDPSLYRRTDFTTGVASTTITLQNPTAPAAGKCLPTVAMLIRTPAATAPAAISWVNLTGGSSIPLPSASQVVAVTLEWVDATVGWLVVGVRA